MTIQYINARLGATKPVRAQCSDLVMKLRHSFVPEVDLVGPSSWFCLLSSQSTGLTPSSNRAHLWITELQAAVYRSCPSGRAASPSLLSWDRIVSSSAPLPTPPAPPPPLLEPEVEPRPVQLLARSLSRLRATSRAERKHWKISVLCEVRTRTHTKTKCTVRGQAAANGIFLFKSHVRSEPSDWTTGGHQLVTGHTPQHASTPGFVCDHL